MPRSEKPSKKEKAASKSFLETGGAVPKPVSQSAGESDGLEPLLRDGVAKSNEPPQGATKPTATKGAGPSGPSPKLAEVADRVSRRSLIEGGSPIVTSSVREEEDDLYDGRGACCTCVRPACCTILVIAGLAAAYAAGYVTREHQVAGAAERITELEKRLGIYQAIDEIPHAIEVVEAGGLLAWFFGTAVDAGLSVCPDGLLVDGPLPAPVNTLFFLGLLLWAFIGVAIGADLFMESIEEITSQETTQRVALPNGATRYVTMRVWNATVANLTLMALGSSAPEILLSVVEIFGNGFYAGALGPSTIVGSAAFNLMVISAVCVVAIPDGEGRYIKERGVFYVTATFSILAYVWLYVILIIASPNVITIAEGVTTLALFPVLVQLAFSADQGLFNGISLPSCCVGRRRGVGIAQRRQVELTGDGGAQGPAKQSRAAYRINATRVATGAATREVAGERRDLALLQAPNRLASKATQYGVFELASSKVSVSDHEHWAEISVVRFGNTLPPASVEYTCTCAFTMGETEEDRIAAAGTISFGPSQRSATLRLEVLAEDKQKAGAGTVFDVSLSAPSPGNELGAVTTCAVRVVSKDSAGMFMLSGEHIEVTETSKQALVTVRRVDGSKGKVSCTVSTQDGKAVAPHDYLPLKNELIEFGDGVLERTVAVRIVNDNAYEGDEDFKLIFENAEGGARFSEECNGGPHRAIATVVILCDDTDLSGGCAALGVRLGINADLMSIVGATWSNQFDEAVRFEGEASVGGLLMYLLALPWRVLFAFAPPPRLGGGWTCFIVVLAMIGVLTALIGDLAAHLGCCMGIAASTTAITIVALGTSLPDTFASRNAAANEEHADSSIGNITGSNSVNVFLGLGLPWAIAAIYWGMQGTRHEEAWRARYGSEPWYTPDMPVGFAVPAGDLGFSVAVFLVCGSSTLLLLLLRRAVLGFELGGPPAAAQISAGVMVMLWFVYIGVSIWHTASG